jgi:hypothetical protein
MIGNWNPQQYLKFADARLRPEVEMSSVGFSRGPNDPSMKSGLYVSGKREGTVGFYGFSPSAFLLSSLDAKRPRVKNLPLLTLR